MKKGNYKIGEIEYQRIYQRERYQNDSEYRKDRSERGFFIGQLLSQAKGRKPVRDCLFRFEQMTGVSRKDLCEHLFSTPELLEQYLNGEIEVDHILPFSWFQKSKNRKYSKYKHFWFNLRLVPISQNRRKKDNIEDELIAEMIKIRLEFQRVSDEQIHTFLLSRGIRL